MRKLKLESLHVESFVTEASPSRLRGTVQGQATPAPGPLHNTVTCTTPVTVCTTLPPDTRIDQGCVPPTMNPSACGSLYVDCSLTTGCPVCYVEGDSPNCPISA